MFNTPLSEIDFAKIEAFCANWEEGVRVEYKREPPGSISKIVSSFANTMGGILVIGVETDSANRAVLPIRGFLNQPGIEERITQACYQGIYPPITPSVRVFQVTTNPGNIVAVVKVPESIEAPHAIQNKTTVYVRVNSTSEPYQLAEIDRIEYFLNRRREPDNRREKLIEIAQARTRIPPPRIRITISPRYPYLPLLTTDSLNERISAIGSNYQYQHLCRDMRRIQGGFITTGVVVPHHLELSFYGGIYYDERLDTGRLKERVSPIDTVEPSVRYVLLMTIVLPIGRLLRAAELILDQTTTNLFVRVTLEGINSHGILPSDRLVDTRMFVGRHTAIQDVVSSEVDVIRETAKEQFSANVIELVKQLMWSFDWADDSVERFVLDILRANGLVGR